MVQTTLHDDQNAPVTAPQGLSQEEVAERIQRGETNDYQARVGRSYWDIFRDNVLNLFNIVLFTLLILVLMMGDYGTVFFAGISVVTNTFLGMIQEMNAKRKLDQLATLSEQPVVVWRAGQQQRISMREVVKDDVLELQPGDKAVVDGVVLESDSLEMDESLLTGESDAVYKEPGDNILSGSFCIAGTAHMRATQVGAESHINELSEIAKQYKIAKTPTQKRIDIIVELSVLAMFVLVPMLFIENLLVEQPSRPFLAATRNAVVFVTTLVPQGLVLTAILSLTIGAVKISQHQTLVQKVNAVESLANATVLCFDKTGTLTQNKLRVQDVLPLNDASQDAIIQQLADYLGSLAHRNRTASAIQQHVEEQATPRQRRKEEEISFSSGRKWGAVIFDDETLVLGAPERLLTPEHPALEQSEDYNYRGLRVLAFGKMRGRPEKATIADRVQPLALIVMSDQIREDIQETLQAFRDENITLKVISGDNLETVRAIASQSGMDTSVAYTGQELEAMSDSDLETAVLHASVFARIEPHTKRRIVTALQAQNQYVAMVGDGVNDVPALKQANLAIVMNDGTQISKDVADIVLLNNAMSTLPRAFKEGRRITQTIFATMKLFLTRGFFNVALFIFALFMGLPFPITPIQISIATFASVNLPAGFLAVGLIRPKYMANFRRDVLDHIVIGGVLGALFFSLLYMVSYLGYGRETEIARAAVTLFTMLYNAYIVMLIQGVDFSAPRTFFQNWRTVGVMTLAITLTGWFMYGFPVLTEFTPIAYADYPLLFWLMVALILLTMACYSYLLRNRYLLHRLWALLAYDERLVEVVTTQGEEEVDDSTTLLEAAAKHRERQER